MRNLQEFLLLCSGAEPSALRRSPSDINKQVGIGGTVLFTSILAFLAASFAFYTIFDSWVWSIILGLIWGFMIFNLDRFIVSSLRKNGRPFRDLLIALPRIAMALVIAVVISKPVELKLFDKEIQAELITMEQEIIKEQEATLSTRFDEPIAAKRLEIQSLKNELEPLRTTRDLAAAAALAEADGTGGSLRRNMGPIYALKKAEADKAELALLTATEKNDASIELLESDILRIEGEKLAAMAAVERVPYNGMAARIEALSRLGADNHAMAIAHLFIFLLFLLIEMAPILVKLFSGRTPYDYHLHAHEYNVEMYHKEVTGVKLHDTNQKLRWYKDVGSYRLNAKIKEERAKIDHELKSKIESLDNNSVQWDTP